MKTGKISIEEFTQRVEDEYGPINNESKKLIVNQCYKDGELLTIQTAVTITAKKLRKADKAESATQMQGVLVGAHERGKGPIGFVLFDKQANVGKTMMAWGNTVEGAGTKNVLIPTASLVRLTASESENDQYGRQWTIESVVGKAARKIDDDGKIVNPDGIADVFYWLEMHDMVDTPDNTRKLIQLIGDDPHEFGVAVKGFIAGGYGNGKMNGIKEQVIIDGHPNLTLRLEKDGETVVYLNIAAPTRKIGIPQVLIEDLVPLCNIAKQNETEGDKQAQFVGESLDKMPVIAIGTIRSLQLNAEQDAYNMGVNVVAITTTDVTTLENEEETTEEAPEIDETETILVKKSGDAQAKLKEKPEPEPVEPEPEPVEPEPEHVEPEPEHVEPEPEPEPEPVTETEAPEISFDEPVAVPKAAPKAAPKVAPKAAPKAALTAEQEKIKIKLLLASGIFAKANGKNPTSADPMPVKIANLKEVGFEKVMQSGLLNKLDKATVKAVYDAITGE